MNLDHLRQELDAIRVPDLRGEIEARTRPAHHLMDHPPAFPRSRHPAATAVVVAGSVGILILAGILLWSSVQHGEVSSTPTPPTPTSSSSATPSPAAVTPCWEVLPGCTAIRLPDLVLTDGQNLGAFGSVDGFDLSGIISSDEALRLSGDLHGKEVRVVLGSADADRLHWGLGTNLYYGVEWGGVCIPISRPPGSSPLRRCGMTTYSVVIDAHTGSSPVEGSGPGPRSSPSVRPSSSEGPLVTDTHIPQARVVRLTAPVHFGVGPSGDVFFEPANPSDDVVAPQTAVDHAWIHDGGIRPTAVKVEFGLLQGRPEGWVVFSGLCLPGTGPSQPPGSSPRPAPSCITIVVDRIDGHTGNVVGTFFGSPS